MKISADDIKRAAAKRSASRIPASERNAGLLPTRVHGASKATNRARRRADKQRARTQGWD